MSALTLVAALDREFAIGRGNALPWHLPADLKRFKALTLGKPILMGRRTAEAIGRALPGRRNLVLTRGAEAPYPGMEVVHSLQQALDACADDAELMVIGGGEIYRLVLPLAGRMWLTHVDTRVDGADAFFPRFDAAQWTVRSRARHAADEAHAFAFETVEYLRAGD